MLFKKMGAQTQKSGAIVALDHDVRQVSERPDQRPEKAIFCFSQQITYKAQKHEQLVDQFSHAGLSDEDQQRLRRGLLGNAFPGQTVRDPTHIGHFVLPTTDTEMLVQLSSFFSGIAGKPSFVSVTKPVSWQKEPDDV